LGSFVGFNSSTDPIDKNESLSIMSFNGLYFEGKSNFRNGTPGDSIVRFIQQENPDIVCFQEFDYKRIRTDDFKDYPFSYVDFDFHNYGNRVIQAIYSKYEILDKGNLEFPSSSNSAVFADIVVENDTFRLYNLHLESLNIRPSNLKRERSDLLFGRLRNSFAKQQKQSDIVREHMNISPYRNMVCGDFNNNQFSSVYLNIKGDLKDTFLEKGTGYGKTIKFWRFPFRIDFILVDPSLEVLSHKNYNINLSDHEPVMASIKIGANE
jgi:endonuclease/exonuclease/phosphatase family metal-dependent hydrolase